MKPLRRPVRKIQRKVVRRSVKKIAPRQRLSVKRIVEPRLPSIGQPNLLITFDPTKEVSARQEIQALLRSVQEKGEIIETEVHGLFKAKVRDPRNVVKRLRELCLQDPEKFERTHHWTPVDLWTSSQLQVMKDTIGRLSEQIKDHESWKLKVDARHYTESTQNLAIPLTEKVQKGNVNLDDPDKVIKVDIIGKEAGISLLDRDEILNVLKIKGK